MSTKLSQAVVDRAMTENPTGKQLYDTEVAGLRIVVGKKSASYKLMGRVNDGTDRYMSIIIGRTDEVSLKTARTRATELRLQLRQGVDPRKPKTSAPTLQDAFDRYIESRGAELRPRTVEFYKDKMKGHLSSLKKLPVDKIDREQVRDLHEKITKRSGPAAANGAMRTLKTVLNDAARTWDLPPNPVARGVRMHRLDPRDWAIHPDNMHEVWLKLDTMEDRVRRACWLVMLLTGLRCGDARTMRWEHIDADGVLTVPSPKGGPSKAFKLPLPSMVLQELEHVRELTKVLESPWVFPSPTSKTGHMEQLRRTDEFPWPPHGLRHTWRTMAMEAGVELGLTMMIMNHKPASVSFNYVTRHNLLGSMRTAVEAVAAKVCSYRGADRFALARTVV